MAQPPDSPAQLRVVIASPLAPQLCDLVVSIEPRVTIIRDAALLPTQRHAGDHEGDPDFHRTAERQAEFERLLDSADALYGLPDESPAQLARTVAANPALRWVHTTPAGGGAQVRAAGLDAEQLERVAFTQSGGVHADPLAEFALLGVLAGARRIGRLREYQDRAEWAPRVTSPLLRDLTVVVVGLGGIGRRTAELLASLGVTVIGVHRRQVDAPGVSEIVPTERLAEVIGRADALVVSLPGTKQTERMIDRTILAAARPGLTFVNVGRGSTVDEAALVEALDTGLVGYAALDVFATEPLPSDSPLWRHPNVLVSPHSAALHDGEDRRIAELFADNARRLLDGEPLVNRVNTVEFY